MCWLRSATELWRYPHFVLAAMALMALVECFAGYRAWRLLLGINGAILGFCVGAVLGLALQCPLLVPLGALAGLVGGASLFSMVEPVGMFVFAVGTGASLAGIFGWAAALPAAVVFPIAAVAGLLTALVCGAVGRGAILTLTAIAGAQQISSVAVAYLWSQEYEGSFLHLVNSREFTLFAVLAVAGLAVQFLTTGRPAKPQV